MESLEILIETLCKRYAACFLWVITVPTEVVATMSEPSRGRAWHVAFWSILEGVWYPQPPTWFNRALFLYCYQGNSQDLQTVFDSFQYFASFEAFSGLSLCICILCEVKSFWEELRLVTIANQTVSYNFQDFLEDRMGLDVACLRGALQMCFWWSTPWNNLI